MSGDVIAAYVVGIATPPLLLILVALAYGAWDAVRRWWTYRKPTIQTSVFCRKCHRRFSRYKRREAIRALHDHDCAGRPPVPVPSGDLIPRKAPLRGESK